MDPRIDLVSITGRRADDPSVGPEGVQNDVWVIGDDRRVLVVDASHEAPPIVEVVGGRDVAAVVCTHWHWDHTTVAPELGATFDAPVLLHPADRMLWDADHPEIEPRELSDGDTFEVAETTLTVLHTPGHTPGSICLHDPLGRLFAGDTLFPGGPGFTAHPYGDFDLIIRSIRERLFVLPDDTSVLPGHGDPTTIGTERPHLAEWIARGW
jgi:hydroxyacylglutathione hydrolase